MSLHVLKDTLTKELQQQNRIPLQPDTRPLAVGDKVAYKTIASGTLKGRVQEVHSYGNGADLTGPFANQSTVIWKITSKLPKGHAYKRGQLMSSQASNPFLWRR